jgi:hypothetical protein
MARFRTLFLGPVILLAVVVPPHTRAAGVAVKHVVVATSVHTMSSATAAVTPTVTSTPTAAPRPTPIPPTFVRILSVRAEIKGTGLDWNLNRLPIKTVQLGQMVRLTMYASMTEGPARSYQYSYIDVSRAGKVIDWSYGNDNESPGDVWALFFLFKASAAGTYTLHSVVRMNGRRVDGWGSLTVVPPFQPSLYVSPTPVKVGQIVNIWITSQYWPSSARVSGSFVSANHSWGGSMPWLSKCSCFGTHVMLASKIHGAETAHVTVRVLMAGRSTWLHSAFTIVGLPPPPKPTATPVPQPTPIPSLLNVEGSGEHTTQLFTPSGGEWRIAYAFDCSNFGSFGNFIITVYAWDGEYVDLAANALAGSGRDVTHEHVSGTFYLKISSECDWHVIVYDGP